MHLQCSHISGRVLNHDCLEEVARKIADIIRKRDSARIRRQQSQGAKIVGCHTFLH